MQAEILREDEEKNNKRGRSRCMYDRIPFIHPTADQQPAWLFLALEVLVFVLGFWRSGLAWRWRVILLRRGGTGGRGVGGGEGGKEEGKKKGKEGKRALEEGVRAGKSR